MAAVTLKDIARELAISESLVSKVLSGRMGTSSAAPEQVQAIRRTARRLGYRPNRGASALATGKQGVIGVFMHRHGEPGSGLVESFLFGVSAAAAERRQCLWLNFFDSRESFRSLTADVHASTMDGLIVSGCRHDDMIGDLLGWQRSGLPVVTAHPEPLVPELRNVGCSDLELAATATRHLLDRGRRRLAAILHQSQRNFGFRYACETAGLQPDPEALVTAPNFSVEAGREAARRLLAREVPFDGLVCQSDHHAFGAVEVLLAAGRRVPDDVAVIGIDDSPICELSPVPLSSVSQNQTERGRRAVDLLMAVLAGEEPQSLSLTPTLQARQSTVANWRKPDAQAAAS